jgi:hypothetical protein
MRPQERCVLSRKVSQIDINFPRITTRLTKAAHEIVNWVCAKRESERPGTCPVGTVLSELVEAAYGAEYAAAHPEGPKPKKAPSSVRSVRSSATA